MMGPWRVSSNVLNGRTFYSVCRLKDTEEVRHSRNLIYSDRGCTNDLAEAEKYAEKLNQFEASLPVCRRCGKRAVIHYFSPSLVLICCDRSPAERRNLRFCSDISEDTLQDAEAAWRRLQA
jgi:hypothetical protein